MTKEEMESLGLGSQYIIPSNIYVYNVGNTTLQFTTSKEDKLASSEVSCFIDNISVANIDEINKKYETAIQELREVQKKHIEIVSQKKN